MRNHSTMRTKDAMTILLVVTLLTNLAQHELGTVSASGDAERRNLSSRRRLLERLFRLGFTAPNNYTGVPRMSRHMRYQISAEDPLRAKKISSGAYLTWFQSNHLPDRDSSPVDSWQRANFTSREDTWPNVWERRTNLFHPSTPARATRSDLEMLLEQLEQAREGVNVQVRRHALLPTSSAEIRRNERIERKKKREGKKRKRNREKRLRRKNKRMYDLIDNEGAIFHNIDGEDYFDCCPSKLVVVEKQVGKDRNNHAVEVRPSQQYFYERICLPGIEGTECVFPARSLRKGTMTRCAQQFSYVQAQVRPYRSEREWQLDYIHVRSGCSCQVNASPRNKRKSGVR